MKHTLPKQLPVLLGFSRADQIKSKARHFENIGEQAMALEATRDITQLDGIIEQLPADERALFEKHLKVWPVAADITAEAERADAHFVARLGALTAFLLHAGDTLDSDAKNLPQRAGANGGLN